MLIFCLHLTAYSSPRMCLRYTMKESFPNVKHDAQKKVHVIERSNKYKTVSYFYHSQVKTRNFINFISRSHNNSTSQALLPWPLFKNKHYAWSDKS